MRAAPVLPVAAALLSACSLVKLSDDIKQANCKSDQDCEVLNHRTSKSFDPCELWQCNATKLCELLPLDADHDGFVPASPVGSDLVCEAKAAKQDCDDDNALRMPGFEERCDGVDNDCDEHVDEDVLKTTSNVAVGFAGENAQGAGDVSFAVDPVRRSIALGYGINRAPSVPGFSVIENDLPMGASAAALKLPQGDQRVLLSDGVGVAALGDNRFAVAFYDRSGIGRVFAGMVASDNQTFLADESILTYGLRCEEAEACAANAAQPTPPVATDKTQTPALAAVADDVVVVYVRNETDEETGCAAKSDSVTGKPVLANLLSRQGPNALAEVSASALSLGTTGELNPPAILGIAAAEAGAPAFGWLVAYASVDGALVFHRVTRAGDALELDAEVATHSEDTKRLSDVSLALGPKTTEDEQLVGATYVSGCSTEGRVMLSLLAIKVAPDGSATVRKLGSALPVGGGATESRPALGYLDANETPASDAMSFASRDSWGVVYRDPKGLRARMIQADGKKPMGAEPYLLLPNVRAGADESTVLLSPIIVPQATDLGWFGMLAYTERPSAEPARAFQSVTLASCSQKK